MFIGTCLIVEWLEVELKGGNKIQLKDNSQAPNATFTFQVRVLDYFIISKSII